MDYKELTEELIQKVMTEYKLRDEYTSILDFLINFKLNSDNLNDKEDYLRFKDFIDTEQE